MTNVYATPEKGSLRDRLFNAAVEALTGEGWTVERMPRAGKASVRRLTRGSEQLVACIRTTQDRWIAFPRNASDTDWVTLKDVDVVVASSVNDKDNPQFALVHVIPGDEARDRFDRAYKARMAAGHSIPVGRGVWVSLYETESTNPVSFVGAGAGLVHRPIARIPLNSESSVAAEEQGADKAASPTGAAPAERHLVELTSGGLGPIPTARRWLAAQLGVSEADIKINVSY